MKHEIGGTIMTKFVVLTTKLYGYLMNDGSQDKRTKDKKCVHQKNIQFENYYKCLEITKLEYKIKHVEEKI